MTIKHRGHRSWRYAALAGVAIGALSAPSFAQDTSPAAEAPAADATEIVVTAQRRSEHLVDVPASVAVATGARLEAAHLTDILDIGRVMPGVSTENTSTFSRPAVRGITTTLNSVTNSGNVATYIDGVYQTSTVGNYFDLVDIDRIEVLKGPQGTLYGRNATAGAILITTKAPSFTASGRAEASYGNFDSKRFSAYVTGPLSDKLAASLSASYADSDGYYRNIFLNTKPGGQLRQSVRGKLLFKPNDWSQFTLIGAQGYVDDTTASMTGPYKDSSAQRNNPAVIKPGPFQISHNFDPTQKLKTWDASLEGKFFLPGVDVTAVAGYRQVLGRIATDSDFSNLPTSTITWRTKERQGSVDLVAASTTEGPFQWLLGANYIKESGGYLDYRAGTAPRQDSNVLTDAFSGFAEGTYTLGILSVTGGIRYITEKRHFGATRLAPQALSVDTSKKWDAWTPRVSAKLKINETSNIYANYSTGWKSGGYNASNPASQPFAFDPEKVKGYEVGYKARPSHLISVEAALFSYRYTDIQTTASLITTTGAAGVSVIYNAAKAKTKGGEISLGLYPMAGMNLQAGLAFTDAKYTSFPSAFLTFPNTVTPPPGGACIAGTGLTTGGNRQCVGNASGKRLPRAPKVTFSFGGSYKFDISPGTVDIGGNVFYNSGNFSDANNRLTTGAYTLLDGTLGFRPGGGKIRLSVWGKNLLDETYPMYFIDQTLGDRVTYASPRTYGVAVGVSF